MIKFKVAGLGIDTRTEHPLVILNSENNDLILPIWIGRLEAQSIALALQEEKLERPLTHDLMMNLITNLGYKIERIEIYTVKAGTFYAHLILENCTTHEKITFDARPSDCVALALRQEAPIFVSDFVSEVSCIPAVVRTDDSDEFSHVERSGDNISPEGENLPEKEEFLNFLEHLKASDFKLPPDSPTNWQS